MFVDDHEPGSTSPDLRAARLGIVAIDHVGVAVPDLDVAIRFHTEVLGLVLMHREVNERQGVTEAMLAAGSSGERSAQVQLLAPLHEGSAIARFLGRSGPGLQHLAYRVGDLDAACAELRVRGLRLLYDRPEAGTRGSRINFLHPKDAGGVLVELVEAEGPHRESDTARVAHDPAGGWVDGG